MTQSRKTHASSRRRTRRAKNYKSGLSEILMTNLNLQLGASA